MTAHHTLAKGHNRTAHGRRSRTGSVASSGLLLLISRASRLRLAICGEADLDAHASVKMLV